MRDDGQTLAHERSALLQAQHNPRTTSNAGCCLLDTAASLEKRALPEARLIVR